MRDNNYININQEPFQLIKDNVYFDLDVIKMCNYKPISADFIKQIYVSLTACKSRVNNTRKFKSLQDLVEKLKNPQNIRFNWNMSIYNVNHENEKEIENNEDNNTYPFSSDESMISNDLFTNDNQESTVISIIPANLVQNQSFIKFYILAITHASPIIFDEPEPLASDYEDIGGSDNEESNKSDDVIQEEKEEVIMPPKENNKRKNTSYEITSKRAKETIDLQIGSFAVCGSSLFFNYFQS